MRRMLVLAVGCVACSTSGSGAGAGDAHPPCWYDMNNPPATPNPNNCVPPGAPGNEKGVGAYCLGDPSYSCQPGYVGCPVVDGGQLFCGYSNIGTAFWTKQYGVQSWCLSPCQADSDCGSGAICWAGPFYPSSACARSIGCFCVPDSCTYLLVSDGGADASDD